MQYLSQRLASKPASPPAQALLQGTVAAEQQQQLLDAVESLVGENGCAGTSIEAIVKRARVSSVTFYEHFADKETCFVAAFDRAFVETAAAMREAARVEASWPDRVRVALRVLLQSVEERPGRARLCLLEAPAGGAKLRARYEAAIDAVAGQLRQGRLLETASRDLPETTEEAAVGGIVWLVRQRVEVGEMQGVEDLLPKLAEIALSSYG